jgi:transcriptional regulator with XRE-family HTH domain
MKTTPSPFPTARPFTIPASARPTAHKPESLPSPLGAQIKAVRTSSGATGAELALRAGVSSSMLSRIERGLVSPSVQTLSRIAEGLGVPVARFFSDQHGRHDLSYVPAGKGIVVDRHGAASGFQYELLGHLLSGNLYVEPYLVTLGTEADAYSTFQHPGIKFIRVEEGRITYRYAQRTMELKPGDSLLFDASALHGVDAILERPVSYLSIVFTLRG